MSTITPSASLSTSTSLAPTITLTGTRTTISISGGMFPSGVSCTEPLQAQSLKDVGIAVGEADQNTWPALTSCLNQGELDLVVYGAQCGVVYVPTSSQDLISAWNCITGIANLGGTVACGGNCTDTNGPAFMDFWTTITDATTTSSAAASSTRMAMTTATTPGTQSASSPQHTGAASLNSPNPVNKMQWALAAMTVISLCVGVAL